MSSPSRAMSCLEHGLTTCIPEWRVSELRPSFHRLYYVLGGTAEYSLPGDAGGLLQHQTLYLFPANRAYNMRHDPADPLRCLWFHLMALPLICARTVQCCEVTACSPTHFVLLALEAMVAADDDIELLLPFIEGLMGLMGRECGLLTPPDARLSGVAAYIHDHYLEDLTNGDLAHIAGFDTSYFTRLFRRTIGISPQQYVANVRMYHAAAMLRGLLPVGEVAARVGYEDPKAFCRAFVRHAGMPPSVYARSHSRQP